MVHKSVITLRTLSRAYRRGQREYKTRLRVLEARASACWDACKGVLALPGRKLARDAWVESQYLGRSAMEPVIEKKVIHRKVKIILDHNHSGPTVTVGFEGLEKNPRNEKSPIVFSDPAPLAEHNPISSVNLDSGSDFGGSEASSDAGEDDDGESLSDFYIEGPLADPDVTSTLQYLVHAKNKQSAKVRYHWRLAHDRSLPAGRRADEYRRVEAAVSNLKAANDAIFTEYCLALGVIEAGSVAVFDKKLLDQQMESCFGSLEKEGDGFFNYPPLRTLSLSEPFGAVKIFSVYLSRKAFSSAHPQDMEKSLNKTFEILTSPPPPVPKDDEAQFHARFRSLVKAALVGFKEEPFAPSSGKSCVELSAEGGGKRVAQYGVDADLEGVVRPKAIWSSGKIRVITIGSCQEYDRFQTIASGLFTQVRKARWCAAGGTIDSWWSKVGQSWQEYGSGNLISGDLEAATDNLDGRLAEIVFEEIAPLCVRDDETPPELVERMKASCSKARLYDRRCKCPGNAVHGRACYKYLGDQVRGQLMGSILSFPILCLVTFATYAAFHPVYGKWMEELPTEELRKRLWAVASAGVNGDDIAFPDEWTFVSSGGQQKVYGCQSYWEKGVRIARGVVSRGKTLRNKKFFTINSELFSVDHGRQNVIRPTLLVAVCEQAFKAPMQLWREMIVSPLMNERVRALFRPEDVLFPDQPRSLGGLGTCLQSFDVWNPVRYLFLKRVREVPEFAALSEDNFQVGAIKTVRGVSTVTRVVEGPLPDPDSKKPTRIVSGWVTRESAKALSRNRFGVSSNVMRWSTPVIKKFRRVEALKNARTDAKRLRFSEKCSLYAEYEHEFRMSAAGLTYVEQVADQGQLDISKDPDASVILVGGREDLSLADRYDGGRPAERQVLEAGIYDPTTRVLEGVKSVDSTTNTPVKWVFGEPGHETRLSHVTDDSTTSHASWIGERWEVPSSCRGRDGFTKWLRSVDQGEVRPDFGRDLRDQFLDSF